MSKKWAVNNTVTKNIQDLIEYDSNPREHAPEQIQQVAESIKEFGWTMPILIDENNEIIAGHGRLLAGKSLGIKEVPCIVAEGWSDEKLHASWIHLHLPSCLEAAKNFIEATQVDYILET